MPQETAKTGGFKQVLRQAGRIDAMSSLSLDPIQDGDLPFVRATAVWVSEEWA